MDYKQHVQQQIQALVSPYGLNVKVYDTSDAVYDGGVKDISIVINQLGGDAMFYDYQVVPIQMMVYGGGQLVEVDDSGTTAYDVTLEALNTFVKSQNHRFIMIDDGVNVKQNLVLPMPINQLSQDAGTYRMEFLVSGTLSYFASLNDITDVEIDGEDINFINATLTFSSSVSSSKTLTQKILRTKVTNQTMILQLQMYHDNSDFCWHLINKRIEVDNPNKELNVTIYFIAHEETYKMVVSDYTIQTDRNNPALLNVTLQFAGRVE